MVFNNSKLLGKIKEKYGTQKAFADDLGIGLSTLNLKINGKLDFDQEEMNKSCDLLDVPKAEIPDYFFNEIV